MAKQRQKATAPHPEPPADAAGARISTGMAAGIFFGLALIYFLPALLPGRGIYGTDYLAGGYPFSEFIAGRLRSFDLPKWVPYVYGGLPLFANAGSTFYPVWLVLALLVPVHKVLPLLFVVQFALAGLGAWLLLRELGARRWVALLGGLAYQFTGLTMSFVYAGHDGRVIVASLAPMFFFFLHRLVRTGGPGSFVGAAATLAFTLLSFQIQSNYYLLLAGLAWGIFALVALRVRGRALWKRLALGVGAVAIGFILNAINFLPFLDYVDQSPRGGPGRGYEYATSWAMPPVEITGVAIPEHIGVLDLYQGANFMKLHTEYVGAVVLLLVLLGVWYLRRDRYAWFFGALALVALTFSFGGHTPIYRLYYEFLPGTAKFRAPSISFFLVSMALVTLAGLALERLARNREGALAGSARSGPGGRDWATPALWILGGASGAVLLVLLAAAGGGTPHEEAFARGALRLAFFTWAAAALIWGWIRHAVTSQVLAVALAALIVVDLWMVDRQFFEAVDEPDVMMAQDDVVDFLQQQPGPFRVWVLPAEILRALGAPAGMQGYGGGFRNYLMLFDIDQVAGEHGNQLQRYNQYLGAGTATYVDWHNFLRDLEVLLTGRPGSPTFLSAANVRYILSPALLPRMEEVYRGRTGVVYEVPGVMPRAWLVGEVEVTGGDQGALEILGRPGFDPATTATVAEPLESPLAGGPVEGSAAVTEHTPDRVAVRTTADRPALMVLADNYYEGWEAMVDGESVPVHRANHTFRGVVVPPGDHEVVLEFRPAGLYVGAWIYFLGFLTLATVAAYAGWRQRGRQA